MAPPMANGHTAEANKLEQGALIALNPRKKQQFRLIEKRELSHNVRMFRCGVLHRADHCVLVSVHQYPVASFPRPLYLPCYEGLL